MPNRFFLLIAFCVTCTGFSSQDPQPSLTLLASSSAPINFSSYQVAQSTRPDPLELDYDRLMYLGYEATKQRDYQSALEYFQQALAQRPGDFYATAAIRNIEGYLSREVEEEAKAENASEQQSLWAAVSAFAIVAGLAGLLLFLWTLRQTKSAEPLSRRKLPQARVFPSPSQDTPRQHHQPQPPIWEAKGSQEEETASEAEFRPKQQTTRLADFDLLGRLVEELYHPNLTKRRRAIQELGQSGDSRAVLPLIERIIDADSYEHSLILEALTKISARVLQPMNQALTTCLEDGNPQVRKNAIRELTQLYSLMAQVNQLLTHATDDSDLEVKQTAQWALSRLNLMEFSPSV